MISAAQAAELCKAIYDPIDGSKFSVLMHKAGITAGIVNNTVAFAGSECVQDWVRDFDALPFLHPDLGVLHAGFWDGMADFFADFPHSTKRPPLVITGHSLGCAHAAIFAGLCAVAGIPVEQLILFAPPRVSFDKLPQLIAAHVPSVMAYKNGFDPVPDVPFPIPFVEPWEQIATYTMMEEKPENQDDIFQWHSIDLYLQGAQKVGLPKAA